MKQGDCVEDPPPRCPDFNACSGTGTRGQWRGRTTLGAAGWDDGQHQRRHGRRWQHRGRLSYTETDGSAETSQLNVAEAEQVGRINVDPITGDIRILDTLGDPIDLTSV